MIYALAAPDSEKDSWTSSGIAGFVLGYFLPILIIMLVTSESSQRNGLVTFTLEPRRSRVVIAKLLAGLLLAAVRHGAGGADGGDRHASSAACDGGTPDWALDGNLIFNGFVLANVIGVFVGFAIAMLLMNTPAAIVAYFVYTFILPDGGRDPQRAQRRLREGRAVDRVQHRAAPVVRGRLPAERRGVGADRR